MSPFRAFVAWLRDIAVLVLQSPISFHDFIHACSKKNTEQKSLFNKNQIIHTGIQVKETSWLNCLNNLSIVLQSFILQVNKVYIRLLILWNCRILIEQREWWKRTAMSLSLVAKSYARRHCGEKNWW